MTDVAFSCARADEELTAFLNWKRNSPARTNFDDLVLCVTLSFHTRRRTNLTWLPR